MFKKILLSALVLAMAATAAQAQVYRWTDSKGKRHVTDAPPPRTAKESRFIDLSKKEENRPVKRKKRPSKNFKYAPVVLYTAPACGQSCETVRELLSERGVKFTEKSIRDEVDEDWLLKQVGEKVVPSVTVGHTVQRGFDPEHLNLILDKAGFPKTVAMPENKAPTPQVGKIEVEPPPPLETTRLVIDEGVVETPKE